MGNYNAQSIQELISNWDDPAARARLIAVLHDQLRAKASLMLRQDFPRFGGATETQSIVDRALTEVLEAASNSPDNVRPNNANHFIEIVGMHMRFRLLKLAKEAQKYVLAGDAVAASHDGDTGPRCSEEWRQDRAQLARTYDPVTLAKWGEFHTAVTALPVEERRVVECLWYLDMTQAEAAEVLGVQPRQVCRLWARARDKFKRFV
jgi:RNA polymerase sigma factor (sigma-70 family)